MPCLLGLAAVVAVSCSREAAPQGENLDVGSIQENPLTGANFIVDANQGGAAPRIGIADIFWGRLVDVYALDATTGDRVLQLPDFAIGDNIASDGSNFLLERSPITQKEELTILHPAGSASMMAALATAEKDQQPLQDKSLTDLPPFSSVPRNAVLVVVFNDLLDAATINSTTIGLRVGYPPIVPFEARVIPDMTHGDLRDFDGDGVNEFYSTRVLLDVTVSQAEAQTTEPPLPINSLGLPPAQVVDQANILLRIPTNTDPSIGQFDLLRNPSGGSLVPSGNGSVDNGSPTIDVVRAFRSRSGAVGDESNGFLADDSQPEIVGLFGVAIDDVVQNSVNEVTLDFTFAIPTCAVTPNVGDTIQAPDHLLVVTERGLAPSGGIVVGAKARLLSGTMESFVPFRGEADYSAAWDSTASAAAECFLRFSLSPTALPAGGVSPEATITIGFSEPMDPVSVNGLETFTVNRTEPGTPVLEQRIVGRAVPSTDLREFTFVPSLPLTHEQGQSETYRVDLLGGITGAVDLSGNTLADELINSNGVRPAFGLEPAQATANTGGFAFPFNSQDMDGDGANELRGQILFDLARGTLRARPVQRFSGVADQSQPVVGAMQGTFFTNEPLNKYGSRLMTVWRYHDVGFDLVDETSMNVDVEFLHWAPFAGIQIDNFSQFRMSFSHSFYLPDAAWDMNPMSLTFTQPLYPTTGVIRVFDDNRLDAANDPGTVVHEKPLGYTIQPLDSFQSTSGTLLIPYPMNRGLPVPDRSTYTWRDTSLVAVGGPGGVGVETNENSQALTGGPNGLPNSGLYPINAVPTIGLPLLMEFRCYPEETAVGINQLAVNVAYAGPVMCPTLALTPPTCHRPALVSWSGGGVEVNGQTTTVDPDNSPIATGIYDTVNGGPLPPGFEINNVFFLGQADFVVRVSRAHSIWFNTNQAQPAYALPVVEPPNSLQPGGTSVTVAFRGADVVNGMGQEESFNYDFYGDPAPGAMFTVTLHNGDTTWYTDPAGIDGAPFFQYRMSFIANSDSTLVPEISSLGVPFSF